MKRGEGEKEKKRKRKRRRREEEEFKKDSKVSLLQKLKFMTLIL